MANIKMSAIFFLALQTLLSFTSLLVQAAPVVKGGYWEGGSTANLNVNFQTHVWYAFAGIDTTTYECVAPTGDGGQYSTFTATALSSNPSIQTLLSIGGGGSNQTAYANMVSASSTRKVFIDSSISLARQNGFHGLDLDWEFPQNQLEMDNMGIFFEEWRAAAATESHTSGKQELLLTAAVSYQSILLYTGDGNQVYPVDSINKCLDWVNVMCFDYHGSWEATRTGEHTALYDPTSNLNTDYGISNWLHAGLLTNRLVLGLAYYGKSWTLVSLKNTSVGAPTTKAGDVYIYSDILPFNKEGATIVEDTTTVSMYSYKADLTWIGYDNPSTITSKVRYAHGRDLLGYFAWALNQDDSKWSLARAAYKAWT